MGHVLKLGGLGHPSPNSSFVVDINGPHHFSHPPTGMPCNHSPASCISCATKSGLMSLNCPSQSAFLLDVQPNTLRWLFQRLVIKQQAQKQGERLGAVPHECTVCERRWHCCYRTEQPTALQQRLRLPKQVKSPAGSWSPPCSQGPLWLAAAPYPDVWVGRYPSFCEMPLSVPRLMSDSIIILMHFQDIWVLADFQRWGR